MAEGLKFFTAEQIGPKRHKTLDGFLVCEDVPIARTGDQLYLPQETPIEPDPRGGPTIVERREEEVFRAETIASFNGKPFVYEHPDDYVTPQSYAALAKGHVMNVRRGTGVMNQILLADLFVTDEATMMAIEQGKRELSCGYRADFYQIAPGRGGQRNIIGNHVALVDRGRCGAECAIGDQQVCDCHTCKEKRRTAMPKKTLQDRLMSLLGVKDVDAFNKALGQPVEDTAAGEAAREIHIHVGDSDEDKDDKDKKKTDDAYAALDKRVGDLEEKAEKTNDAIKDFRKAFDEFTAKTNTADADEEEKKKKKETEDEQILGALEMEAPPGTGDKARAAKDSAYLADSFQQTLAYAEILAPGLSVPVFDRAGDPRKTYDAICRLRRTALELAHGSPASRAVIDEALGGKAFDVKAMSCQDVRALFMSAGLAQKSKNSATAVAGVARTADGKNKPQPIASVRDLNKANADFYGKANG